MNNSTGTRCTKIAKHSQTINTPEAADRSKVMERIIARQKKEIANLRSSLLELHKISTSWQPISTAPKDNEIVDIWSKANGRLTDYYLSKRNDGSYYYYPVKNGATFVTDATHWMPTIEPNG